MTAPFKFAHAAHADWTQAAQACMNQLGAIPVSATLGFLYVSDALAGELGAILAFFRSATAMPHWTGSVGVGVCATGREYLQEPAMVVMLAEFDPADFSMLPLLQTPQDIDAHPLADAYFAMVHGDPANNRIQELIEGLSARLSSGFVVGGLSSSEGVCAQISDGVVSGGLSGVLFSDRVPLATRLTQGVSPLGPRHRVTAANKNVIGSLDNRPALDVMKEEIGEVLARDLRRAAGYIYVGLPVSGSDTGDYVVRNILGVDPQNHLVAISEYIQPGDELLFCRRDQQAAEDDLLRMLAAIRAQLNGPIRGGVYYSCLGRGQHMFGTPNRELGLIRDTLGDFPLVGFFANGEISHNRLYGYTGVLTLFG
ncbi:MAG: FIST C-terminal domain-containing protein [Thiobacillus sp.]|uniref:FIST signal transduction protein n=1 Tax=Thiobacillus sp. TaxID=924 RepID=UPI002895E33B|nr:FIST C-terminal domain-containing protein [Thiobacillus sp.]MDT3707578.1 FIST C-terminal domain-containing protein [Thiobacillus sp.]